MSLFTKDRSKLAWTDVERLGAAGGWTWIRFQDREFTLDGAPMASADISRPVRDGEVRVRERVVRGGRGEEMQVDLIWRGVLAPAGAFERYAAKAQRSKPRPEQPKPIDMLGLLPALAGTPGRGFVGPATGSADPLKEALDIEAATGTGRSAYVDGRAAVVDAPGLLAWLGRKGVTVTIVAGDLWYIGAKVPADVANVIRDTRELQRSYLTATPCPYRHDGPAPVGTRLLLNGRAACAEHADGTLAP